MGQKVNPTGFRVGITEDWKSRWYAPKAAYGEFLVEDFKIRKFVKSKYSDAGVPKIEIERTRDAVTVFLHTARPGFIIGRKGAEVERLQEELQNLTGRRIEIKIQETEFAPWPVMTNRSSDVFGCLWCALARDDPPLVLPPGPPVVRPKPTLLSRIRDVVARYL